MAVTGPFRVGDWTVEPDLDRISRGEDRIHLRPQVMRVLVYLSERQGEVAHSEDLMRDLWSGKIVTDATLYNCVAELRNVLNEGSDGRDAIQTVPKKGYRLTLPVSGIGAPEPQGQMESSPKTASAHTRRMGLVVIALLSAAILLFAYDKWWTESTPERSVAVLPFVAMSSGEDDGYFADGLTEEILNSLTQLQELQVTARTSSFFFKGKDVPIGEIANLLNVAHIVEGSVRRDGERLRISTQLIRARDGFHLWSQTYDRTSEDIFAIQQDIAENVAETLNVALDDEARERMRAMRINDVEAFIAYQKGLDYFYRAHNSGRVLIESLSIANAYFDTAIEAQPNLVAARVLKSDRNFHVLEDMIEGEEPDIDKVRDQLQAYWTELDFAWRASPSGNQRDILDLERALVSEDWTGLSALIKRAMQPGDCPRINIAEFVWALGFSQELAKKLEESLACNPLDPDVIFRLARAYNIAGRPDESLELLGRAEAAGLEISRFEVTRTFAQMIAGQSVDFEILSLSASSRELYRHLMQGDEAEARRIAEHAWGDPNFAITGSLKYAMVLGDRARANEVAARIDKYPGSTLTLINCHSYCIRYARLVRPGGCRNGLPFDLDATPNLKARIEESGLQWPPVAFQETSTEAL